MICSMSDYCYFHAQRADLVAFLISLNFRALFITCALLNSKQNIRQQRQKICEVNV
jgi:hypothetical protein